MADYKHDTGTFVGKGGTEIFFQSWTVANPRGVLVIAHGLGEHSGRYGNIIERLKGGGVSIYALDHRGHGKSGGRKGHVDSFMDFIYDLKIYINLVRDENRKAPLILLGHSMGGVIALKYALTYPDDVNSLILSSAGLVPAFEVPKLKLSMGKFFSKHMPSLTLSNGLKPEDLSHDASVVQAYIKDPLVHDRITARWSTEYLDTAAECIERSSGLKMPLLVFHGQGDRIVDYRASETVFKKASAKNKELHIFPDLYHETMNEVVQDRKKVLDMAAGWILRRLGKGTAAAPKKAAAKKTAKPAKTKKAAVKKPAGKKAPVKKAAAKKAKKR